MAAVAFDKHIGFCEEYVDAMSEALQTLIQEGARSLNISDFFRIRQKWALWLTREIEAKLDLFEVAISKIAAGAQIFDDNGFPVSNERSFKTVIASLRELLATEELTALRSELVGRSSRRSPNAV